MKLNHEIFHKFFYTRYDDESGRAKSNTSFYGWTFKSYNTTIGIKTPGKDGRPVLLIADSSFSNTTSAHLSALCAACPYTSSHIIRVPFDWGTAGTTLISVSPICYGDSSTAFPTGKLTN